MAETQSHFLLCFQIGKPLKIIYTSQYNNSMRICELLDITQWSIGLRLI